MNIKNLVGSRFGRLLLVVERIRNTEEKRTYYRCMCDCGKEKTAFSGSLTQGLTNSCGCIKTEMLIERNKTLTTIHGESKKPGIYCIWRGIIQRCENPSAHAYELYGGRGISVCDRWRKSFVDFKNDMGPRPSKVFSIDRIDTNGNYCPENCRWATDKEQNNNRRDCIFLELDGQKMNITQWAEALNVPRHRLYSRHKRGWSVEDILS